MKLLLCFALSISMLNAKAQKAVPHAGIMPYQNGVIHITDVVKDSLSKDQLFDNAVTWFANATNSINNQIRNKIAFGIKDNIIISDKPGGEFMGTLKGIAHQSISDVLYSFDVYIYVKDGRYKYDFTNFKYLGNSLSNAIAGQNMPQDINLENIDRTNRKNKNVIMKINEDVTTILKGLKESMAIHSASKDF